MFMLITVHTGPKKVMPHVAFHTFSVPTFSTPAVWCR